MKKRPYSGSRKKRPSSSTLPSAPPALPSSASASSEAGRPPLVHLPLLQRGVAVRGSQRVAPAWVLMRSPLPPPAVWWERRGWGGSSARASASGGVSDSAASSLPGVGVAGYSRLQESLVLANPSPVASSVSALCDHRSRSCESGESTGDHSRSLSSRSSSL